MGVVGRNANSRILRGFVLLFKLPWYVGTIYKLRNLGKEQMGEFCVMVYSFFFLSVFIFRVVLDGNAKMSSMKFISVKFWEVENKNKNNKMTTTKFEIIFTFRGQAGKEDPV